MTAIITKVNPRNKFILLPEILRNKKFIKNNVVNK